MAQQKPTGSGGLAHSQLGAGTSSMPRVVLGLGDAAGTDLEQLLSGTHSLGRRQAGPWHVACQVARAPRSRRGKVAPRQGREGLRMRKPGHCNVGAHCLLSQGTKGGNALEVRDSVEINQNPLSQGNWGGNPWRPNFR